MKNKKALTQIKDLHARAQQALSEARQANDEKMRLSTAGTLTEARGAELDATYSRAFTEYSRLDSEKRRAQELADAEDAHRAFDEDAVPTHPRDGEEADGAGDDDDIGRRGSRHTARDGSDGDDWRSMVDVDGRAARGMSLHSPMADRRNTYFLDRASRRRPAKEERAAGLALERAVRSPGSLSQVEMRALSSYRDADGGWALTNELSREVIRQMRDEVFIMQRARVFTTTAASISFPVFRYKGAGNTARREGAAYAKRDIREILGKKSFSPNPFGDIITVPEEFMADLDFPVMELLAQEIAADGGEQKESYFLTGDGNNKPIGAIANDPTTSAPYIPYFPTAGASLKADDVKGFPFKLKATRRKNASWMWSRGALEDVSKFRSDSGAGAGTGNYLFQPGLTESDPNKLVGYPVLESEFFPDGTASGAASATPMALFCDWFMGYWIIMRSAIVIRRLDERYADEGLVGFRYSERYDAAPVRLDAFALLRKA